DAIPALSRHGATMVIFLGTEKLEEILARVEYPPETPAAVVYHASWPDERVVVGTVADVAAKARAAGIEKTALLLIGGIVEATRSDYRRSVLYS
ncbi:MAG: cobalt-precorrin-4 C(11)-methyltransferase, partial [Methanobacteriota archaeon]